LTMTKGVTEISPAFQWAQSLDNVMLSVKFATRMDSPGCLDTFDPNVTITPTHFLMTVSCRIDKQVFRYDLNLELFGEIDTNASYFELGSVGRLYANLTKAGGASRWRRLLKGTERHPNMQLWWEIHEKHEQALLKHTQFETDEDFMEGIVNVERPKKLSKKAQKAAAKRAAQEAAAAQEKEVSTTQQQEDIGSQ
jgi:hypothetical protein